MSLEIRRRASIVCLHNGKLLTVKLRDPQTKVLRNFPPGGRIESDETPAQAAYRECLEETGVEVSIDKSTSVLSKYPFFWNGKEYECHTTYFKAEFLNTKFENVDDVDYNEGPEWVAVEQALENLSFDRNIKAAVDSVLNLSHKKNADSE